MLKRGNPDEEDRHWREAAEYDLAGQAVAQITSSFEEDIRRPDGKSQEKESIGHNIGRCRSLSHCVVSVTVRIVGNAWSHLACLVDRISIQDISRLDLYISSCHVCFDIQVESTLHLSIVIRKRWA